MIKALYNDNKTKAETTKTKERIKLQVMRICALVYIHILSRYFEFGGIESLSKGEL